MRALRRISAYALALAVIAAGSACTSGNQSTPTATPEKEQASAAPGAALEQARSAASALGAELMSQLAAELNRGGPAAAVQVCSRVAPEIAARHSTETLTIRRVSLRVRNPADRPDAFEQTQLELLETRARQGDLPAELYEVREEGGAKVLRYLRPIVIGELCLQCHGEPSRLDSQVTELLAKHYPRDEAVGYQVGDLRGAFSVKVELE